jgi:hypothetical protein
MSTKTVTITENEYKRLIKDSYKLKALGQEGVDNWVGYDYAMDTYEEWVKELENEK